MLRLTYMLVAFLALSLRVTADAVPANASQASVTPSQVPAPKLYSPVELSQLCADSKNYCIYVDQVRPGAVRASPVVATDARKYSPHPF